jgi:hypothetical protein
MVINTILFNITFSCRENSNMGTNPNDFFLGTLSIYVKNLKKIIKVMLIDVIILFFF